MYTQDLRPSVQLIKLFIIYSVPTQGILESHFALLFDDLFMNTSRFKQGMLNVMKTFQEFPFKTPPLACWVTIHS